MTFDSAILANLSSRISAISLSRRTRLAGIDGRGGAGKSTLARDLAELLGDVTVVAFDDFYRAAADRQRRARRGDDEIGGDFDWRRLRDQVLEPLTRDETARYQRYDWDRDQLAEWHAISPGRVVIVEGNYATRPELRDYYDLTIWVDAPRDVRLRRGLERDGDQARARWLDEWMPEEDRYIASRRLEDEADILIDGSAGLAG